MEAGIVTITLTEYESYKELQNGLKKRKVISSHYWNGKTFYAIEEGATVEVLAKIIEAQKKEIDDLRLEAYNLRKSYIEQAHKLTKKWWQI